MPFRGVALGNDGSANTNIATVPFTIPPSVQAGDIIYVTSSTNFGDLSTGHTATIANTGTAISWTQLREDADPALNNLCYLWEGIALSDSAGQTATVTWSAGGRQVGIMIVVSGDTTTGRTVSYNNFSGSSSVAFAAVTALAGADVIAIAAMRAAFVTQATIATAPTGFTKEGETQSSYSSSAQFTHTAFLEAGVSAGSITPSTVTANETVNGNAYTIQVPPGNLNDLMLGTGTVDLDYGTNHVTSAFLGTGQVWP